MGEGLEQERKAAIRLATRRARADLSDAERADRSAAAVARLVQLPELRRVRTVALYSAGPRELDLGAWLPLLRERHVTTLYPRVDGDDLVLVVTDDLARFAPGFRGVNEPDGPVADLDEVDAIVVPGVAFDPTGGRVGQGGGHFDRLLAQLPDRTLRVGVAFSCQVVPRVPREPHDQPVDLVVTDRATYRAPPRPPAELSEA